jgi:hypothetical protein
MCNYCYTGAEARTSIDTQESLLRRYAQEITRVTALSDTLKNINREQEYEILDLRKRVNKLKQDNLAARLMVISATEKLDKASAIFGKPLV